MKKFLPYILILIILAGLLSPVGKVNAAVGDACTDTFGTAGTIKKDVFGYEYCAANTTIPSIPATPPGSTLPGTTVPAPNTPPATEPTGKCVATKAPSVLPLENKTEKDCNLLNIPQPTAGWQWTVYSEANPAPKGPSGFETAMESRACVTLTNFDPAWCAVKVADLVFHTVPAFILAKVAYFFNILISISLNGDFLKQDFVSSSWGIVRDLSNIFFILILLYIAVKIILDLGGSEAKKMIVKVIIIALLINFSMFFTQVIIDSSNIVALIFYNKVSLTTKDASEKIVPRPYDSIGGEKDVAGGMVNAFDPTRILTSDFFKETAKVYSNGKLVDIKEVPAPTMLAIILISGLIMCFAIYALFITGLSFLGRLIELWVLIIFSPFAFMSSTVPKLSGAEYLGWDAWFKRLINVSFMAPIFMFFLYFIFLLISSNVFKEIVKSGPSTVGEITNDPAGATKMLLGVVMPAIFICILLLQATKFAKKGSGVFGEVLTKAAGTVGGMATGLALGAATGGAAVLGRATLGRVGAKFANSAIAKQWESGGMGGEYARRAAAAMGSSSFDVRGVKIGGKTLAGATGLNVGEAQKGGFTERRAVDVKKRQERAKDLEVGEDEELKQNLNKLEEDKQGLLRDVSHDIDILDKRIETWRKKQTDASTRQRVLKSLDKRTPEQEEALKAANEEAVAASNNVRDLNLHRSAIKSGKDYTPLSDITAINKEDVGEGQKYSKTARKKIKVKNAETGEEEEKDVSINDLEDYLIPEAHHHIEKENRDRKWRHAETTESEFSRWKNFAFSGGQHSYKGAREAAHNIRMEAKIDEKGGGGH